MLNGFMYRVRNRYGAPPHTPPGTSSLEPSRECPYTGILVEGFLRALALKPPETFAVLLKIMQNTNLLVKHLSISDAIDARTGWKGRFVDGSGYESLYAAHMLQQRVAAARVQFAHHIVQ